MTRSITACLGMLMLLAMAFPALEPAPAQAQGYPRLFYYGAIKRNGYPVYDTTTGILRSGVLDELSRYHELSFDVDPITPYRPAVLSELRLRNPGIRLLGYVTGHYIWYSADGDSLNHYPTRYWRTVRDLDGFLYNKAGAQFGLTISAFANVNLAKKNAQGHYVVAESLAALFNDVVFRQGKWDGIFIDTFCEGILWAQTPAESIDYVRAGYPSLTAFDAGWKAGGDTLASKLRARAGGAAVLVGNCAPSHKFATMNGWMLENFPYQTGGTWYSNMFGNPAGYFLHEAMFRGPHNNHLSTSIQGGTTIPYSADNCRRARLGLASAALGDGFASFVPGARNPLLSYYDWWYDEFAVDLVTGHSSPLAKHTGWLSWPTGPWYQLIWVGTNPDAVTNPGVETDLSGWTLNHAIPATLTRDLTTAAKGSASMKVHVDSPGTIDWQVNLSTTGSLTASYGKIYSATFWAKASSPRTISVIASHFGTRNYAALSTAWTQYQVAFPSDWSGSTQLQFYLGLTAGDVWLDDVHFQEGATTVYRRDFEHGIVVVNPSYSTLNVPLGRTFKKILGTADPTTNNGGLVSTVTVKPVDALFLIDPQAPTGVGDAPPAARLTLRAPEPNPRTGAGATHLALTLPRAGLVHLELYDAGGRRVASRPPVWLPAGAHTLEWAVGRLAPGLYFARLVTESSGVATAKWTVLR